MKRIKKKRRLCAIIAAILGISLLTGILSGGTTAYGFEDYRVEASNDFIITVQQKEFSGSTTEGSIRYRTEGWYLFQKVTNAVEKSSVDSYRHGFKLSSQMGERTETNGAGIYYQDFVTDADEIVKKMLEWYDAEALAGGVTVYACRAITVYKTVSGKQTDLGTYYNYPDLMEAASWSGGTKKALKESYDIEITITFGATGFAIQAVDENGDTLVGYSNTYDTGIILYGQTLDSIRYPGEIAGYKYTGYEWSNGSGYVKTGSGTATGNYLVDYDNIGENDLVLTFRYQPEKKPDTVVTPDPDTTIAPTLTPTGTPKPTPTPTPETYEEEIYENHRYFSTDKGYTLDAVAKNEEYVLSAYTGVDDFGKLPTSEATVRSKDYLIGMDADGNLWYFLADGTNAAYVHPAVYNGYDADTEEVKHITSLTFPSQIIKDNSTYTVTSIGGGSATYHTVKADSTESKGAAVTEETTYDYGIISGSYLYSWTRETSTSDSWTEYSRYTKVTYGYGVLGNGYITSTGEKRKETSGIDGYQYLYQNNYYVYNTTLTEITIPDTVTQILPEAFQYCEALSVINYGDQVIEIGESSFMAAAYKTPELSTEWESSSESETYVGSVYYFYNESYSTAAKTTVMAAWEDAVTFKTYLILPEFPSLTTLGINAFAYHTNLDVVILPESTARIGNNAFLGCLLDSVTIPASGAVISSGNHRKDTLGTKGNVEEKTVIYTEPDAADVIAYGRTFTEYYVLKCGYSIIYEPNGAQGSTQKTVSDMEDLFLTIVDGGRIGTSSYYYAVESDGSVWIKRGSTFTEQKNVPAPETVLYNVTFSGTSHMVYYDADGKLWHLMYRTETPVVTELVFTNTPVEFTDFFASADSFSGRYAAEDGCIYSYSCSNGTITESLLREPKDFVREFYFKYNSNTYTAGEMADGTLYYAAEASAGWSKLSFYPSGQKLKAYWYSDLNYRYAVDGNGNAWTHSSETSVWTKNSASISGDIIYAGVLYNSYNNYSLIQDSTGDIYVYKYYKTSADKSTVKKIGTAASIIEKTYAIAEETSDGSYNRIFYLLLEDGSLYYFTDYEQKGAVDHSTGISGIIRMAGEKIYFKELYLGVEDGEYIAGVGLATNGTIWGLCYGGAVSSIAMTDISNGRTYTDIAGQEDTWTATYALGTDGYLYGIGYAASATENLTAFERVYHVPVTVLCSGSCAMTATGYITYPVYKGEMPEYIHDAGYRFVGEIIPNTFFIRKGYDFTGWNSEADGTGDAYEPGERMVMTEDLTLYAQWAAAAPTIHYNANGGRGSMADTVLAPGVSAAYLSKNRFTRTDYKFIGWNTSADGSGTAYEDGAYVTGVNGYLELFAQWEEVVTTYTLVYMKYPYGSAGNTAWKQKTMINSVQGTTKEMIEGAPYAATGYTVSYDVNRADSMSMTPVLADLEASNTQSAAPFFEHWRLYLADDTGRHIYQGKRFTEGDIVSKLTDKDGGTVYLYPVWGGTNASVILPQASCDGYLLLGWSETEDGSTKVYPVYGEDSEEVGIYIPAKDVTLYAIWERDAQGQEDFRITDTTDTEARKELLLGNQALVLKKGHWFSYTFITEGTRYDGMKEVKIIPRYFWTSEDGAVREEANVYYHAVIDGRREYFILAGEKRDTRNGQTDGVVRINRAETEVETEVETEDNSTIIEWKGEFSLPSEMYIVIKEEQEAFESYKQTNTLSGQETFFKQDGYLIVSFEIVLPQASKEEASFTGWEKTELAADIIANGWDYRSGDVIRYDLSKSIAQDYEVGGVE